MLTIGIIIGLFIGVNLGILAAGLGSTAAGPTPEAERRIMAEAMAMRPRQRSPPL